AFIDSFSDKKAFVTFEPDALAIPADKEISMKFLIGTEVFFIKTSFKTHMNSYYFDMTTKVIQLKRRKEPRFNIPKGWNHTGAILLAKANETIKCGVMDISKSGIRFEILDQLKPALKRDDFIKIKFQVHKRGEVQTMAIVRFILHRNNASSLLGLEFANITEVQNERVASIVSDIELYIAAQKT
ncbi:MAG: PilZ domain-containing protein, partial [Pseudobdellovibrio sp.]